MGPAARERDGERSHLAPRCVQHLPPSAPAVLAVPAIPAVPADAGGTPAAFDALAAGYDAAFSRSTLGRLMREAVWRRLDLCFAPGDRVIELGCGTGEDATHLGRRGVRVLATDASVAMLAAARRKIESAGLAGVVELRRLAIEDLRAGFVSTAPIGAGAINGADATNAANPAHRAHPAGAGGASHGAHAAGGANAANAANANARNAAGALPLTVPGLSTGQAQPLAPPFDGALSNFGALNCVADLTVAAAGLAACVRPGGVALLCVMGPLVPWEWAWFLRRGRPGEALRRLRPGGARWRGLTVHYPTVGRLRRLLAPAFRLRRVAAIGALLPPSYAESWALRHLSLVRRLAGWERRCETWAPLPWLADHYLVEMERR